MTDFEIASAALEDARAKYIDADFMAMARPLDPGAQQYRREAYAAWIAAVEEWANDNRR